MSIRRRNFLRRFQARKYDQKAYKNPFFRNRNLVPRWKIYIGIFFALVILSAVVWTIMLGPFSSINKITVTGLTTIPNVFIENVAHAQMNEKRFFIFPQSSRYLFSIPQFSQSLQTTYDFTSLEITIDGRILNISAQERVSELVWKSGDLMWFLDLSGTATRLLYDYELAQIYTRLGQQTLYVYDGTEALPLQPSIPILVDVNTTSIETEYEGNILGPMHAETIISFDNAIRLMQIVPLYYELTIPHQNWLTLKTASGCDILIDGTRAVGEQETTLKTVLQKYRDQLSTLEYIDIRFGDRVYIK